MHAKDWLIVHLYINMDWVSKSVYRHVQWKQNVYTALHWMDSAYTWPLLLQASQSTLHHPFVLIVANGLCFSCIKLLMDPLKCNWDWICGRSVCLLAASNLPKLDEKEGSNNAGTTRPTHFSASYILRAQMMLTLDMRLTGHFCWLYPNVHVWRSSQLLSFVPPVSTKETKHYFMII